MYRTVACLSAGCTTAVPLHQPQTVRTLLFSGEPQGLADALGYTMRFIMLALLVYALARCMRMRCGCVGVWACVRVCVRWGA